MHEHSQHHENTENSLNFSGPEFERLGALKEQLEHIYATEETLPYHGWHHIQTLLIRASALLERCEQEGIEIDEDVLTKAILFHDILYHLDHSALDFKSKEELSAHYAYRMLRKQGANESHARAVAEVILSTHHEASPKGAEQILMRAADLGGIAASYEEFRSETEKLHKEAEFLSDSPIDMKKFMLGSVRFLAHYLCPVLELTDNARTHRKSSAWHEQAARNILALYVEAQPESKIHLDLINESNAMTMGFISGLSFYLGKTEEQRRTRLDLFETEEPEGNAALVPLPYDHGLIPLPSNSVDSATVDIENISSIDEVKRVVRQGGEIEMKHGSQSIHFLNP